MKDIDKTAQKIVKRISQDLVQEWKGVDDDVRMEIEESWEKAIVRILDR